MNKQAVNEHLQNAVNVLADVAIAENGKINGTYRAQISCFGAAVTTGSLPAAVAFFSRKGGATVNRPRLMEGIRRLINCPENTLFDYVKDNAPGKKEKVVNAAVALKLAMNLYELVDEKPENNRPGEDGKGGGTVG